MILSCFANPNLGHSRDDGAHRRRRVLPLQAGGQGQSEEEGHGGQPGVKFIKLFSNLKSYNIDTLCQGYKTFFHPNDEESK